MNVRPLTAREILDLIPHRPPMRFISEIAELDEEHILARYTWTLEDCAGHFPEFPIVPGVKIIECAAQAGCVAWGIYHLSMTRPVEEIRHCVGCFTSVDEASFKRALRPGDRVEMHAAFGEEGFFRGNKICAEATIRMEGGGDEVFSGRLSGVWMPRAIAEKYAG